MSGLCKSEVCARPGWTAGRVERFLTVEHEYHLRGFYGAYTRYEYSLQQIEEAEHSLAWRGAAAKYLKVGLDGLDHRLAEIRLAEEAARATAEEEAAKSEASRWEELEKHRLEIEKLKVAVGGGLCLAGYAHPLCDGWRTFTVEEVMPYVAFREETDAAGWTPERVRKFYSLWNAGAGYCNPMGAVRKIIAGQKSSLIALLLEMAKEKSWTYGVKTTEKPGIFGLQEHVLYIDTTGGQVSFHLRGWETDRYPKYRGEWSGVKNSGEIIAGLLEEGPAMVREAGA